MEPKDRLNVKGKKFWNTLEDFGIFYTVGMRDDF